jgi:RNA polymerase sigma-70 factor (ECF subfamily)
VLPVGTTAAEWRLRDTYANELAPEVPPRSVFTYVRSHVRYGPVGVSLMAIDWEHVYSEHAPEIAGYLAKLVGDRQAGSDLMQETFVRALRAQSSIREPVAVRAWLYRTATNLASSYRRRRALLAFLPFGGAEHAPDLAFDIEAEQVHAAMRSIPADQAATLLLFYERGFSRREIAELLHISEETVKSRLARGRRNFMAAFRRLERGLAR